MERLNLTIRQGSAYLQRRSPAHARSQEPLADPLELLRCYYNFVRPHGGLKFGSELRTPAMQAGLVDKQLTFRGVFMAVAGFVSFVVALIEVRWRWKELVTRLALALQQLLTEAPNSLWCKAGAQGFSPGPGVRL